MKKLFFAAIVALLAVASAGATNYVVWQGTALAEGDVQLPYDAYEWWQMTPGITVEDAGAPGGTALTFKSTSGGAAASCGFYIGDNGKSFDMSLLAQCDLVFYAKATSSANYTIRLTGNGTGDQNIPITVPADGDYHPFRINIQSELPNLYEAWMKAAANDDYKKGYIFAVVMEGGSSDADLRVYDIHYESAVDMPTVSAEISDIATTSATLTYAVEFPEGYINTMVRINGEVADANSATLSLTGLDPKTSYTYTVQASGEYNGQTYTAEKSVTFTTLRETGDCPVWYGSIDGTTVYNEETLKVHVDYNVTYNDDNTLTIYCEVEGMEKTNNGYKVSLVRGIVEEWKVMEAEGNGHAYTTTATVAEGTEVEFFFWLEYPGGVFGGADHVTYVAGQSNEEPAKRPRVTASVDNITYNSADVNYSVAVSSSLSDYTVTAYITDGEHTVTLPNLEGSYTLTGLSEHTAYGYDVYAVAVLGETTLESAHVALSFQTPYENAADLVYSDYAKAVMNNAYFAGEDESMRRTLYVSLPFTITYTATGEGLYQIDLSEVEGLVGLAPQIWSNGFHTLVKNASTGLYEYNFGACTQDAEVPISHYIAYSGGVYDFRCAYTKWGMEKEQPTLGEAANLQLSSNKAIVAVGEQFILSTIVTDADGYYLSDDVEWTASTDVTINKGFCHIYTGKGTFPITAKCGDVTATIDITVAYSAEATDLAQGIVGDTDTENVIENTTAANATDHNTTTELRWGCTATEEHYLHLDLGKDYYVEAVYLLFEGAYATDFKVTLTNNNPSAAASAAPSRVAAVADKEYEVTGGTTTTYTFTQDPNTTYRYVSLTTSKALNTGWGIKVKEMQVYGSLTEPTSTTGIESVAVDRAPAAVEGIFTLTGVRLNTTVDQLAPGFYIVNGSKVLVK